MFQRRIALCPHHVVPKNSPNIKAVSRFLTYTKQNARLWRRKCRARVIVAGPNEFVHALEFVNGN